MGIENDTKEFLVRIIQTISWVMIWMLVNTYIGIYKDYGFFENRPNWTNYLFYLFLIGSFIALVIHLRRKWKL
jgi:hypothetical protein